MTPIRAPKDEPEEEYNEALTKTRQVIERTFGLLKSRFRCLDKSGGVLQYKPQICCRITVACVVLHNYCMRHHVSFNEPLGNIIGPFHNLSAPGSKAVYLGFQKTNLTVEMRYATTSAVRKGKFSFVYAWHCKAPDGPHSGLSL